jgi:hypothetical protein
MIRLRREQIIRLGHLLEMCYRPSELAAEIGCHTDTVYHSFIPAGCPHERDEHGHIWIVGTQFADWARHMQMQRRTPLADGEAYCLRCRAAVQMIGPLTVTPTNRYLELVTGTCAVCGATVNRARARCKTDEKE